MGQRVFRKYDGLYFCMVMSYAENNITYFELKYNNIW